MRVPGLGPKLSRAVAPEISSKFHQLTRLFVMEGGALVIVGTITLTARVSGALKARPS